MSKHINLPSTNPYLTIPLLLDLIYNHSLREQQNQHNKFPKHNIINSNIKEELQTKHNIEPIIMRHLQPRMYMLYQLSVPTIVSCRYVQKSDYVIYYIYERKCLWEVGLTLILTLTFTNENGTIRIAVFQIV